MATYLKYLGTDANHAVGVVAPGNNQSNPLDGCTTQIVGAVPGTIVALYPDVAAAVLAKEPTLWEAVSGFTG
jgi:hypothetical protein